MAMEFQNRQPWQVVSTGVNFASKEGYLLKDDGAGVFAVNDSTSAPAKYVVQVGRAAAYESLLGMLGAPEPLRLMAGGTIHAGQLVKQGADGRVVADATGSERAIVGVARDEVTVGNLVYVQTCVPYKNSDTYMEGATA